jgi:hypothetical protein
MTICTLDMLSSAFLFHHNVATEANPLLRPFAEAGTLPFVSAKLLSFLPALLVAEWYQRRRPKVFIPLLRWVTALYVGIYTVSMVSQYLL